MQEKAITERFPDGESYENVKVRIADFLKFLKQNYNGKSVVIVANKARAWSCKRNVQKR